MRSVSRFSRSAAALAALSLAVACAAALTHAGRAAATASAASASAASASAASASAATASAATKPAVTISHYSFQPGTLMVSKGSTVIWVNKDDDVHTIKSTDGPEAFSSPALDNGKQFSFTFRHAGTYHYVCSVHPFMRGVIVVR